MYTTVALKLAYRQYHITYTYVFYLMHTVWIVDYCKVNAKQKQPVTVKKGAAK